VSAQNPWDSVVADLEKAIAILDDMNEMLDHMQAVEPEAPRKPQFKVIDGDVT